jgi:chemotaxis protein MotA
MYYVIGLGVSFLSIVWSIIHLRQSATNYVDPVGFAVVFGGTLAVAIMVLPWNMARELRSSFKRLFSNRKIDYKSLNHECLELIQKLQNGNAEYTAKESSIAHQTLSDGVELINLGFTPEKIHTILEERVHQWLERNQKIANSIRSLAKYPPAFGLVGTVLGLVSLMRAISEGASSTEAGFRMAVALVATLYGLLVSNLLLNPAGESILRSALDEKRAGDLALEAIMLAADNVTLLEAQEVLNSKVSPENRVNLMGDAMNTSDNTSEAAA